MKARKNETGNKYGLLTVIKPDNSLGQQGINWLCICACGNYKVVPGYQLRRGRVRSCGCLARINSALYSINSAIYRDRINNPLKAIITTYRNGAKLRGLCWELTPEQALFFFKGNCYYCGSAPHREKTVNGDTLLYNGIDRKDSRIGYIYDNCVSCCTHCNTAKSNREIGEYISWILQSANNIRTTHIDIYNKK